MIKIKKELNLHLLQSLANMNLSVSLVVLKNDTKKDYDNGDDYGLATKKIDPSDWKIEVDENSLICWATSSELNWVSTDEKEIEVVGYYVYNESYVLFYDIFKNSVTLEKNRPFSLVPSLAMPYSSSDNDFFDSV